MALISESDAEAIVNRLLEKTIAGEFGWTKFEGAGDQYRAFTSRFVYFVRSRDDDGAPPYTLEIWKGANLADEIESTPNGLASAALAELYRRAKRAALGIDRLADDVLKDLN